MLGYPESRPEMIFPNSVLYRLCAVFCVVLMKMGAFMSHCVMPSHAVDRVTHCSYIHIMVRTYAFTTGTPPGAWATSAPLTST